MPSWTCPHRHAPRDSDPLPAGRRPLNPTRGSPCSESCPTDMPRGAGALPPADGLASGTCPIEHAPRGSALPPADGLAPGTCPIEHAPRDSLLLAADLDPGAALAGPADRGAAAERH